MPVTRTPAVAAEHPDYEAIMEKKGAELLAYVKDSIERMDKGIFFHGSREPSQFELEMTLVTYEAIWNSLSAMRVNASWAEQVAQEKYDIWYAQRYMQVRNEKNSSAIAASKYLSTTEIGYEVVTRFADERVPLIADLSLKKHETMTIRHLLDGWKNFRWTLSDLRQISTADEMIARGSRSDPDENMADMAANALSASDDL